MMAEPIETADIVSIDYTQAEQEMRAYAASLGLDFDSILATAAGHFENPIKPWITPMTTAELDAVIADDDEFLKGQK